MVAKTRSAHATTGVAVGVGVGLVPGVADGRGEGAAAGPQLDAAPTISKRIAAGRQRCIVKLTRKRSIRLLRVTA